MITPQQEQLQPRNIQKSFLAVLANIYQVGLYEYISVEKISVCEPDLSVTYKPVRKKAGIRTFQYDELYIKCTVAILSTPFDSINLNGLSQKREHVGDVSLLGTQLCMSAYNTNSTNYHSVPSTQFPIVIIYIETSAIS